MNLYILGIMFAVLIVCALCNEYHKLQAKEWREKAAAASFMLAQRARTKDERAWGYRNALLAHHEKAERFYFYAALDKFIPEKPLTVFYRTICDKQVPCVFVDYYIPAKEQVYTSPEQQNFCRHLYAFKDGRDTCLAMMVTAIAKLELPMTTTIIFMPCSTAEKYKTRFTALAMSLNARGYNTLLYSMTYLSDRQSKHLVKDRSAITVGENVVPNADIVGRKVIIIDDVMTTGESVRQHAESLRRYGVEVVGVVCLGLTVRYPGLEPVMKQAQQDDN
jgi:uracil phosphoribosyltransferase